MSLTSRGETGVREAVFSPSGPLKGRLQVPPDKSISHRAALLAAMSSEPVRIANYLKAADTKSTLAAIRRLGALVEVYQEGVVVRGVGLRGAEEPQGPIDVGNAGTLLRLLPGWLAGQPGRRFTLDGDRSIRRRPVDRVAVPLQEMGARISCRENRYPPLEVEGAALKGITYRLPQASAQVKSCLLLAGLLAEGPTVVVEPVPTRDHSERLLAAAGVPVQRQDGAVQVLPVDELGLPDLSIGGDPSSAAFFAAAATLIKGSRIVLEGVCLNRTRVGFFRILERMGGLVVADWEEDFEEGIPAAEPVGEIDLAWARLNGTTVSAEEVPLAIDELPLVALLGCFAEGETVVEGAQELRFKESDRIASVVEGLRGLGARIEGSADGFRVEGTGGLRGGRFDARGDHRLAMLGAVAGLASKEGVKVVGMEAAAVSYPSFEEDLKRLVAGPRRRLFGNRG